MWTGEVGRSGSRGARWRRWGEGLSLRRGSGRLGRRGRLGRDRRLGLEWLGLERRLGLGYWLELGLQCRIWLGLGTCLIGFGSGLFAIGTLTAAMELGSETQSGLALGAWGAVQATAAGLAIAAGGAVRDLVTQLASSGALGSALTGPATGYGAVYHLEILVLFAALVAIGPLVRQPGAQPISQPALHLAEFPG